MELPPTHPSRSNVFYFFWLTFASFWNFVCSVIVIVLQSLKLYHFPAPPSARDFSMCAPFLVFFLNLGKIRAGKIANRSEHVVLMVFALIAAIGALLFDVYFLIWQPYVWTWEAPFHYVSIVVDAICILGSIILVILFAMSPATEPK
jgi:hypothetical protein